MLLWPPCRAMKDVIKVFSGVSEENCLQVSNTLSHLHHELCLIILNKVMLDSWTSSPGGKISGGNCWRNCTSKCEFFRPLYHSSNLYNGRWNRSLMKLVPSLTWARIKDNYCCSIRRRILPLTILRSVTRLRIRPLAALRNIAWWRLSLTISSRTLQEHSVLKDQVENVFLNCILEKKNVNM